MKKNDNWMQLSGALRKSKTYWPEIPTSSIRAAVVSGEIPHRRTSNGKRAHYLVKWKAIMAYLKALEYRT
jgi:hypothetical protein